MKHRQGFTLVEVMIAMVIMAFLTVLVSQSIRTAVQNKKKLEARIVSETLLYDTLRVIKLDVERAFNYQDVFWEIENLALQQLEVEKENPGGDNNPRNAGEQRPRPIKLTHFLGESDSMHFTALNHFRTKYNAQESDQMEVGYYLDGCTHPDKDTSTQCLWRRSSPQIDDQVDQGGPKVVVAHNVTRFELEYRSDLEEDEWVSQWRSNNSGRNQHRNKFPNFVKIRLAIEDTENKKSPKVEQTVIVQVAFPNNEPHIQSPNNNANPRGRR